MTMISLTTFVVSCLWLWMLHAPSLPTTDCLQGTNTTTTTATKTNDSDGDVGSGSNHHHYRSDGGGGPVSFDELKKAIKASFDCRNNPGMVVGVVKDGHTVLLEAFGETTVGSGVKVTPDTKFLLASLSKAFTAAVMVSVFADNPSNESYALSTPLRDILGTNFSFADDQRTKYASAEDVLSHRIGLPNKYFMRFNPAIKGKDYINYARYWKTSYPFRGKARYSSSAFTLAAAISARVGGKSWEDLATDRLLKPLSMTSTGFASRTNFSASDVAKPYSIYRGRESEIDPVFTRVWNSRCGSGCVVSTGVDMIKWMNFFLSGGLNGEGVQVLPKDQMQTLTKIRTYLHNTRRDTIQKPAFPVTSVAEEYALGWRKGFYRGYKVISHSGSSPGYASMIMLYPDDNFGIFIAMNGDDSAFEYRLALIHYISDFMLGQAPWLNTTTLCSFPMPWAPHSVLPSPVYETSLDPTLPYINYIGAYKNALYGEVFVNFNQSTFSLQGFYGIGSWRLYAQKEPNTFYGEGMWATDFWGMDGWRFLTTKGGNPKNITSLVVEGFGAKDWPVFEREFN